MDIGGRLVRITSIYMLLLFIHLVDQVIVISVPLRCLHKLQNQQAVMNVADDFDDTIASLSHMVGSLKVCDDSILRAQGYRTSHFRKHKYLMVYTIDGDRAVLRVSTMIYRITRISCADFPNPSILS